MGYYMAGGFFSSIGKAISHVAKAVVQPAVHLLKPVIKPIIKAAVNSNPITATASSILAVASNAVHGASGPHDGGSRVSQLLAPSAAPAAFPAEGQTPAGFYWQQMAGRPQLVLPRTRRATRRRRTYYRRRRR